MDKPSRVKLARERIHQRHNYLFILFSYVLPHFQWDIAGNNSFFISMEVCLVGWLVEVSHRSLFVLEKYIAAADKTVRIRVLWCPHT